MVQLDLRDHQDLKDSLAGLVCLVQLEIQDPWDQQVLPDYLAQLVLQGNEVNQEALDLKELLDFLDQLDFLAIMVGQVNQEAQVRQDRLDPQASQDLKEPQDSRDNQD